MHERSAETLCFNRLDKDQRLQ